jgi:hypothetical protein
MKWKEIRGWFIYFGKSMENDWRGYWREVIANPYKLVNDFVNGAWRLCSGGGIIIIGAYLSGVISVELSKIVPHRPFLWEQWYGQLIFLFLATSPAITADVWGCKQLWAGKDILNIVPEKKVESVIKKEGTKHEPFT